MPIHSQHRRSPSKNALQAERIRVDDFHDQEITFLVTLLDSKQERRF